MELLQSTGRLEDALFSCDVRLAVRIVPDYRDVVDLRDFASPFRILCKIKRQAVFASFRGTHASYLPG
ncbi:MAG: hypothetical protein F4Y86_12820 [Gammaproteobacteria bacterium]|nr:hypothetical protein [Gammaproteobacteria bacterium]MYB37097.1 hypothetical protein [Gammaproteobacteria bacterium]